MPSRVPGRGPAGVGLQAGEDGVADLAFQRAEGFFGGLALGEFLAVVGAVLAVPVADLGDRGHVDGVVEAAVPAPAQPEDLALDARLIPVTVPELLRLLRDTVIPSPRRDRAHRLHWSAWRRRHRHRARQAPPTLDAYAETAHDHNEFQLP